MDIGLLPKRRHSDVLPNWVLFLLKLLGKIKSSEETWSSLKPGFLFSHLFSGSHLSDLGIVAELGKQLGNFWNNDSENLPCWLGVSGSYSKKNHLARSDYFTQILSIIGDVLVAKWIASYAILEVTISTFSRVQMFWMSLKN